jgi:hypothetical protein
MNRLIVVVVLLLGTIPAAAQEMTIFDLNDFVDPRALGAAATSTGTFTCPCVKYLISRAIVGWDHDFVNVTLPTKVDVGFAHVATSFYMGRWQVNAKAMALRDVHRPDATFVSRGALPREALTLQLGHYREVPIGDDESVVRRLQVTWRLNRHRELSRRREPIISPQPPPSRMFDDVLSHEFGVEYDVHVAGLTGSIAYTLLASENRNEQGFSDRPSRLSLIYRFDAYEWKRLRFEPTLSGGVLGHGVDLGGHLTIQPSVRIALPVGWQTNLNARIAPTFQRHGGWQRYYEVAVFVDRPIFAKTW